MKATPINDWGLMDPKTSKKAGTSNKGSALVSTLVVFVGISSMIYATTALSTIEVKQSRQTLQNLQSESIAQAGVEMGKGLLQETLRKTSILNPIDGIAELFDAGGPLNAYRGEPLVDNGATVGTYSVSMELLEETDTSVTVRILSTGYLGDAPANLALGSTVGASSSLSVTVKYELESSEVFDYAYFINNWGWLYGHSIYCNGNARSNGQFDSGGYHPTMTGQPTYDAASWDGSVASLAGYQDDNSDGLSDGNDGGIFSGWDIVRVHNVRGNGGRSENQHDFEAQVPMPNLSDLTLYEEMAIDRSGSITVGGNVVVDGVLGDDAGELDNLYLVGTPADPIVLNGPVVIRGDVIISGTVTGQGAIYNNGNIYVPNSLNYLNGPDSRRPDNNTQEGTEEWLSDNWDKDFLGLFSAENIVVGDYTHNSWRHTVGGWMASGLNSSVEDAGEDGIPNTYAGRDGIVGTADDDVLEGDGIFTVEHYSDADDALGIIPDGFDVGDIIPGSGEDIDGDGQFDAQSTLADLDMHDAMTPADWGGNMPAGGIASYSTIGSLSANNLDATFYTNHSFCYFVVGNEPARINGSMVARNESIVYGTPGLEFNYDARLLGGSTGAAGDMLPTVVAPLKVIQWRRLDEDPLRNMDAPGPNGDDDETIGVQP